MSAVDPLTVPCDGDDGCGAGVGEPCVVYSRGKAIPCAPVRARVEHAEAVAKSNARRIPRADASRTADEQDVPRAIAAHPSAVDPLLTACPRDNCEEAGQPCIEWEVVEVGGDGRPTASRARVVEPHPERVEKAERLVREIYADDQRHEEDRARRTIAAQIAADLCGHDLPTIAAIHDLLRAAAEHPGIVHAVRHAPKGIAAIGRVLSKGGRALGVVGSAPDRTPLAHARKAAGHLRRALAAVDFVEGAAWAVDADTGELHATCAAGRLALAIDGVLR